MDKILSPDQRIIYPVADEECDGLPKHSPITLLHPPPNLRPKDSELPLNEVFHALVTLIEFKDVDPLNLHRRLDVNRGVNIAEQWFSTLLASGAEAPESIHDEG